jgi:hypothetical protein
MTIVSFSRFVQFTDDQVECMCEALLQLYPASSRRLASLLESLSPTQTRRCADSESLLRARAAVAFDAGAFADLFAILDGSHVFDPANHPALQKVIIKQHSRTFLYCVFV